MNGAAMVQGHTGGFAGGMVRPAEGRDVDASIVERLVMVGDLSKLSPVERVSYYGAVCRSVGLNPLTQPFQYISLQGKLTLYATKNCTDQLRQIHGVSVRKLHRETSDGVHIVTADVAAKDGREDQDIGAVNIAGLRGENLANALMKATTKAKRRATLSICGLSFLDESEVESIPDARRVVVDRDGVIVEPKATPAAPDAEQDRARAETFGRLAEAVDAAETASALNTIAKDAVRLHKAGRLTDQTFAALKSAVQRKRALVAGNAPPAATSSGRALEEQDAAEVEAEVMAAGGDQ